MEKFWIVVATTSGSSVTNKKHKTYEAAEKEAKQFAGDKRYATYGDMGIMELVALAQAPVPNIEVVKVTA